MTKKLKEGTLWDFSTSILSQNIKKLKERPYGEKQSHNAKKTERGNPLVSPGILCYIRTLKTSYPNFGNVLS